ncbi:unnamed protein product [Ilex paraguariensis]|uniref:NAC domain-containing protein n=1 Tax=Ilex paraguariensis TaxID=185542 RepID=A0ABC8UJV0_9AQUA
MEVEDNSAVTNPSETHLNQDRTPPPNNSTNGFVNYLVASLPPGVCFQPSDQELAGFYLKRKLNKKPLPPNQIQEVHVYKHNPHTLAEITVIGYMLEDSQVILQNDPSPKENVDASGDPKD